MRAQINNLQTKRFVLGKYDGFVVMWYLEAPKGWHRTRICCFCHKIDFCWKKSPTRFFYVKTYRVTSVVATSFLYLTFHRRIAGDVPIYQKFALKVTTPSENADIDRFRLVSQPW